MVNLVVDVLSEDSDEPPSSVVEEESPSVSHALYLDQYVREVEAEDAYVRVAPPPIDIVDGLLSYTIQIPAPKQELDGEYQTAYWSNLERETDEDVSKDFFDVTRQDSEGTIEYGAHLIQYLLDSTPDFHTDSLAERKEDEQEARVLRTFFDTLYRRDMETESRQYSQMIRQYTSAN